MRIGGAAILHSSSIATARSIGVSIVAEPFCIAEISQKLARAEDLSVRGTAADAVAGLRLLADPGVSVLIVGLHDAPAFVAAAKERQSGVRVLVVQAEAGAEAAREALDAGADGCCLSGIRPEVLRDAIVVLAQGAVWLDREIASALFSHPPAERGSGGVYERLSPRERDVLDLLVAGRTNDEIAEALGRARPTVRTHLASVYRKLGVNDRVSAVVCALRERTR
jgi:DNA-binding NarL/FixJ family response regulator